LQKNKNNFTHHEIFYIFSIFPAYILARSFIVLIPSNEFSATDLRDDIKMQENMDVNVALKTFMALLLCHASYHITLSPLT
jgi:hypothetical protein